jgi:hypothetical protein
LMMNELTLYYILVFEVINDFRIENKIRNFFQHVQSMKLYPENLGITLLLAALLPGLGHIYIGIIRRGTIVLIVAIALILIWIYLPRFVPYPYGWIIVVAYWIWQIVDARRLFSKKGPDNSKEVSH